MVRNRLTGAVAAAIALAALMACPVAAWAKGNPIVGYAYLGSFGAAGTGPGQFGYGPQGLAMDANGNIYAIDSGAAATDNPRVEKFDSGGGFLTQWGGGGSGNGQFNLPTYVAIGPAGTVYVTDGGNTRVQEFTPAGAFLTKFGTSGSGAGQFGGGLGGIDTDAAGNVYVADHWHGRIEKFDFRNGFLQQWGSPGAAPGQLSNYAGFPYDGLATDAGANVYIADTHNNRVEKFTSSGAFLKQWGSPGKANGQFDQPTGVTVDPAGNVWVTDRANGRIQEFSSSGVFLRKIGPFEGDVAAFLFDPVGIAVDAAGHVFVADTGDHRISRFGPVFYNGFLGQVAYNTKLGQAILPVKVPLAGTLKLSGKGIAKPRLVMRRAAGGLKVQAGRVKVRIAATGKARRTLLRTGSVKLRAKISFTPKNGTTVAALKTLRLRKH